MLKYILIGMAMQALISALLSVSGAINLGAGQQAIAGVLFLALALVFGLTQRAPDRG